MAKGATKKTMKGLRQSKGKSNNSSTNKMKRSFKKKNAMDGSKPMDEIEPCEIETEKVISMKSISEPTGVIKK